MPAMTGMSSLEKEVVDEWKEYEQFKKSWGLTEDSEKRTIESFLRLKKFSALQD